jgi:hypothetical protein
MHGPVVPALSALKGWRKSPSPFNPIFAISRDKVGPHREGARKNGPQSRSILVDPMIVGGEIRGGVASCGGVPVRAGDGDLETHGTPPYGGLVREAGWQR